MWYVQLNGMPGTILHHLGDLAGDEMLCRAICLGGRKMV
jgi:hypothetical protein